MQKQISYTINTFFISSFFLFACITLIASEQRDISIEVCEKKLFTLQCSVQALQQFTVIKNQMDDCSDDTISIKLDYDMQSVTPYTVRALLLQAKDLEKEQFNPISFVDTTGLMQLAEKLEACDALKDKIAQIPYVDSIYDTLYHAAFSTQNTKKSEFEPEAARQWLLRCIPQASDEKKIALRKILYPLQYTSAAFTALKNKVSEILQIIRSHEKIAFHELQEFKTWQNSFEHKAYCATKPSNVLSCTEFYRIKQKNKLQAGPDEKADEEGRYSCDRYSGKSILLVCGTCAAETTVSSFRDGKHIIACNECMKKNLAGKKVDLSDCYNLDMVSLHRIIGRAYYSHGDFGHWDIKTSEAHEHLEHLPQIHLPLLELLIHYEGIHYYEGDGGFHPTCTKLNFGTSTVELNPVDMSGLRLFSGDSVACIFNVKTKKIAYALKPELAKLRRSSSRFFIELHAPDADIEYEKWDRCYPPIYRNDRWLITGIPRIIDTTIFILGVMVIWNFISKAYNQQWNIYLKQLNACADTIPHDVKAMAGYLSANQQTIFGKDIEATLPKELAIPSFSGNANDIRLPDATTALAAINQLKAIQSTHQPTYGWHGIQFFGLGCIGMIGKICLDAICAKFAKPGIVKSTLQLLGFIESECSDVACYMQIVRPPVDKSAH